MIWRNPLRVVEANILRIGCQPVKGRIFFLLQTFQRRKARWSPRRLWELYFATPAAAEEAAGKGVIVDGKKVCVTLAGVLITEMFHCVCKYFPLFFEFYPN